MDGVCLLNEYILCGWWLIDWRLDLVLTFGWLLIIEFVRAYFVNSSDQLNQYVICWWFLVSCNFVRTLYMISWLSIHFSMMTNWMNEYVQLSMTYLMHKLIDLPMHIHKWWRVLPSGGTNQNCTMFLPVICGWCVDSWTWAKTSKKAKTMALRWNLFWKPLVRRIVRCLFQVSASFNV